MSYTNDVGRFFADKVDELFFCADVKAERHGRFDVRNTVFSSKHR